jgi:hypothetical protein
MNDMHTPPGYEVQRIEGPMSETVLEAAINVSPTPVAAQGRVPPAGRQIVGFEPSMHLA